MAAVDLERIPAQVGTLVVNFAGEIESSSGEFEGGQDVAASVLRLYESAKSLSGDSMNGVKRVTVASKSGNLVMTESGGKVYVVKTQ